jgi:membrane protein
VSSTDSVHRGWITDLWHLGTDTYTNWRAVRTIRLGAGIAYYALFAIVPLLSLSIVLAQFVVSSSDIEQLLSDVGERVGLDQSSIQTLIDQVEASSVQTGLGLFGLASLVGAALFVFFALQDAFDEIWELPVQQGATATLRHRLTALAVVGGGGVLIVMLLVVNAVSGLVEDLIPGGDELWDWVDQLIGFAGSWFVLLVAIGVLFQLLTRIHIEFRALATGAVVTGALLTVGTSLLGVYLKTFGVTSLTGAAGAILLTLVWFYYVSQILLVGAHLTRVLHERQVDREALNPAR